MLTMSSSNYASQLASTTISTLLLLLLLLGLVQHHSCQPQQADNEQLILKQLLRLAAPAQQQPQPSQQQQQQQQQNQMTTGRQPGEMTRKKQTSMKPSKQQQQQHKRQSDEEAAKRALKQKWHALVDELVDSAANAEKFQAITQAPSPKLQEEGMAGIGSEPAERLSNLLLVKRKPQPTDLDGGLTQSTNGLESQMAAASQPAAVRALSQAQHARRIMDDGFGILQHSIFSSNNQLGTKEAPKFGSDEQF